jgi:hypothetical protein
MLFRIITCLWYISSMIYIEYGTALTTILPILFLYLNTVIVTAGTFERNESGRFGAIKSDSTHHFFRNACTKSGSLRFPSFRLLTDFVCLYNYEFWLSLCKIVRSSVILLLPLSIYVIKFDSDLRQVGDVFRVPLFPPPIKLTATI